MKNDTARKIVAKNRKVRHEFEVLETVEAGIELKGPEVKSIRAGDCLLYTSPIPRD